MCGLGRQESYTNHFEAGNPIFDMSLSVKITRSTSKHTTWLRCGPVGLHHMIYYGHMVNAEVPLP